MSRKPAGVGHLRIFLAALILPIIWPLSSDAVAADGSCLGKPRDEFYIILDVGHSEKEPGATSARGVPEYEFNLNLARRIAQVIMARGFRHVEVMITKVTGPAALRSRWEKINRADPDLVVSIHHDSVQDRYLKHWEYNNGRHEYSDRYRGFSLFLAKGNGAFVKGRRFASALADALMANGLTFSTHHAEDIPGEHRPWVDSKRGIYRYDGLAVPRHSKAPAVLFEAGVIVNRDEELLLSSGSYQDVIAESFASALGTYCPGRE